MHKNQSVTEMAAEVLERQARLRARRTGQTRGEAFESVIGTEAGRLLATLREGRQAEKPAELWQENLPRQRDQKRKDLKNKQRKEDREKAAFESFMERETRELALRRDGQLAALLGEPLPGESAEALQKLASEDVRQAEEGLVALMNGREISYKRLDELSHEDRPLRVSANKARTSWLKERQDRWLAVPRDSDIYL